MKDDFPWLGLLMVRHHDTGYGICLMTTGLKKLLASSLAVHLQVGQRWWQDGCRGLLARTALKTCVILGLDGFLPAGQIGDLAGRIWMCEVSKP